MLSERVQYPGKADFLELNFQNSITQNTGKCKLDRFLHSHIIHSWHIPMTAQLESIGVQ